MLNILKNYSLSTDFVHAVYALDIELMRDLIEDEQMINPNVADYGYVFTWYQPVFRNLPKYLLEIALDTKQEEIIHNVLLLGPDVNLYHSKLGNPFYFLAYEIEYKNIKADLLHNANFNVKNYRGQTILVHLVNLYLQSDNKEYNESLFSDFCQILNRNPSLIIQRDDNDVTLHETLITLAPNLHSQANVFLNQISQVVYGFLKIQDIDRFKEMVYDSYGFILMNTLVPLQNDSSRDLKPDDSKKILFRDYILDSTNQTLKEFLKEYIDFYANSLVIDFFKAIKMNDMLNLKAIVDLDKKKILTNFKDFSGRTCLHVAILFNRPIIFK